MLRLPPGERDPDHYTLLGLPYFEQDRDAIVRAAMERTRLLEACEADLRPGYPELAAELLVAVREAQLTLLDPLRREAYDNRLIGAREVESPPPRTPPPDLELAAGALFANRYRIMRLLRRGALGLVYEALDANLRIRVQVSALCPELSFDGEACRRIAIAARAAASLHHPNVLRADEVGEADGLLFVRMRHVDGNDLIATIEATRNMRLEAATARRTIAAIASALAHAHERGVVHGDLTPHVVFIDARERVLVADFAMARAVADESGRGPRTRVPEKEASKAGDLFALGCLAYQMVSGMPPFAANSRTPQLLPDDVPEDLKALITRLLARGPAQRPAGAADVAEQLGARRRSSKLPLLLAVAAVAVVAMVAALLGRHSQKEELADSSLRAQAWRQIARREYDAAIPRLREAIGADPADAALKGALATALEGKAGALLDRGQPANAQRLLAEALDLDATPERRAGFERARAAALARLDDMAVSAREVSRAPALRIAVGEGFGGGVEIAGRRVVAAGGVAEAALRFEEEGAHTARFRIEDLAGNVREGERKVLVDRSPPELEVLEPAEGASLAGGRVIVRVRVRDRSPPESVRIWNRKAPLANGVAETTFNLRDGAHTIEVVATDRAGNETRARRSFAVDSRVPDLALATRRIVTAGDRVTVAGRVRNPATRVTVGGQEVEIDRMDGSFEAEVAVERDIYLPVIATGSTGLSRKLVVEVLVDREPPRLEAIWDRRDAQGRLLYGSREMDAGRLTLSLDVKDRTDVSLTPAEGKVEEGRWILAAQEGARTVRLEARDEAGNRSELVLEVEGHRSVPHLSVQTTIGERTNDTAAALDIDADGTLFVQGEPTEPGRIRLELPEGEFELLARAVDRYGNTAEWSRLIVVDRTPPRLNLEGGLERGIGRQLLTITADEDLASLTCAGRTVPVKGRTARVTAKLEPSRRRLHVEARDLAGNVTEIGFPVRVVNRVLVLDGSCAVRVPLTERMQEFTVECWVQGMPPSGSRAVLSKLTADADFGIYWCLPDMRLPGGLLQVRERGLAALPARKPWSWEEWTHLALCFDGKRARFFVNGSLQRSIALGQPLAHGSAPLFIGAEPDAAQEAASFFRGAIDEVRVSVVARYARVFRPARFLDADANTLLLLRFDSLDEGRVPDASGNGLHGVPVGEIRLETSGR
ncbi:MAG: protein kinase domain-containing protein [Planctomycetota bacterium]